MLSFSYVQSMLIYLIPCETSKGGASMSSQHSPPFMFISYEGLSVQTVEKLELLLKLEAALNFYF